MKKLLAIVLLSAFVFSATAATDTMWPNNSGRGSMDTSLVTKAEVLPLEEHLTKMEVNFVLTKTDGSPNRLIVVSGSPDPYNDVNFLCRVAEEYGGVNEVFVYKTVDGKTVRTFKNCK